MSIKLKSFYVPPTDSFANLPDGFGRDAELCGEHTTKSAKLLSGANPAYIVRSKDCLKVILATRPLVLAKRAVAHRIDVIRQRGIPPQVWKIVIERVAVIVAALHSFGAWTNKRDQHKAMNAQSVGLHAASKSDHFAQDLGAAPPRLLAKDSSRNGRHCALAFPTLYEPVTGSNFPGVANFVVRKLWYFSPFHALTLTQVHIN